MVIGTLSRVKTFKDPYGEISKVNLYVKLSNEGMKIFMSELRAQWVEGIEENFQPCEKSDNHGNGEFPVVELTLNEKKEVSSIKKAGTKEISLSEVDYANRMG